MPVPSAIVNRHRSSAQTRPLEPCSKASRHLPALPLTSVLGWAIDFNRDIAWCLPVGHKPTTPKRLEDVSAYKFGFDVSAFKLGFDAFAVKKDNATYQKKQKKKRRNKKKKKERNKKKRNKKEKKKRNKKEKKKRNEKEKKKRNEKEKKKRNKK